MTDVKSLIRPILTFDTVCRTTQATNPITEKLVGSCLTALKHLIRLIHAGKVADINHSVVRGEFTEHLLDRFFDELGINEKYVASDFKLSVFVNSPEAFTLEIENGGKLYFFELNPENRHLKVYAIDYEYFTANVTDWEKFQIFPFQFVFE